MCRQGIPTTVTEPVTGGASTADSEWVNLQSPDKRLLVVDDEAVYSERLGGGDASAQKILPARARTAMIVKPSR